MKTILFIACMALLTACSTGKPKIINTAVQTKERVIERLVAVEMPADSALFAALIECDSARNVVVKLLSDEKSKRLVTKVNITPVTPNSKTLSYAVKVIRDTVYVVAKDSIVYQEVPIHIEVPVEVNRLTSWQHVQIWAGRIFLVMIGILILVKVKK